MTNLKDYIDFAVTLTEMEEVKSGKFPLPSEISFRVDKIEHLNLQMQAHQAKGLSKDEFESKNEFTVEIFNIEFKFIKNES
jgi:hypothetical protein